MVKVRKQHGLTVLETLGPFKDLNKLFESFHHVLQASEAL